MDVEDAIVDPVEGTGSFSIKNLTISSKNVTASGLYRRFRLPLNFIAPGLELSEEMDFRYVNLSHCNEENYSQCFFRGAKYVLKSN